ncbi:N-acetyltransferase domain-containing protein [Chloropicon roscoffensis]|uniref:N-acetyltransferase domain-containing protein n=1 Tax=Chloropicon roscoffensis TaxID=1461544 RepID=A0AAX4PH93_9CHLO
MAEKEVTFELATSESLPDVQGLTDLINRVYRVSEDGLWKDATFQRTCAEEVSDLIRKGEIVLARAGTSRVVLGCVQSRMLDEKPTTGSFGMLVVDPDQRNRGIGKRLIEEAEKLARSRGADTMQLELLHPKDWKQKNKARLAEWYPILGYLKAEELDFEELYPRLAPGLTSPCWFTVFSKRLNL